MIRGTLVGSLLGILPGGGAILSSFTAYMIEKKSSRNPESFGKGNLCGVGRVGLDFWPLPVDGRAGQYRALSGSVDMHLGPSASTRMFLYPGPKGPAPTWRSMVCRRHPASGR